MRSYIILTLIFLFSLLDAQNRNVEITIYNNNLALVRDVRELSFKKSGLFHFQDVSNEIITSSVHFNPLKNKSNFTILEQNYDYDLVSMRKLLSKNIDTPIEVVSGGKTYKGVLLSYQSNIITLDTGNGIQIIKWADAGEINLKQLPEGLITRPTLVWNLLVKKAATQPVEISYLTRGISWEVNYVGVYRSKKNILSINAWAKIDNKTAVAYPDAKIKLMAGDIHQERQIGSKGILRTMAKASSPEFKEKEVFEYHLYELNNKSTIKSNQQKQISFFIADDIPVKKVFRYDAYRHGEKVYTLLTFKNDEKSNLGKPLPKGLFRIYQKTKDSQEFIGEDRIDHTPRKKEIELKMGAAFDLSGKKTLKDKKKISKNQTEEEYEIVVENHKKKDAVEVEVLEHIYAAEWEILKSNFKYEKVDHNTIKFIVKVPNDKKIKIEYKIRKIWKVNN